MKNTQGLLLCLLLSAVYFSLASEPPAKDCLADSKHGLGHALPVSLTVKAGEGAWYTVLSIYGNDAAFCLAFGLKKEKSQVDVVFSYADCKEGPKNLVSKTWETEPFTAADGAIVKVAVKNDDLEVSLSASSSIPVKLPLSSSVADSMMLSLYLVESVKVGVSCGDYIIYSSLSSLTMEQRKTSTSYIYPQPNFRNLNILPITTQGNEITKVFEDKFKSNQWNKVNFEMAKKEYKLESNGQVMNESYSSESPKIVVGVDIIINGGAYWAKPKENSSSSLQLPGLVVLVALIWVAVVGVGVNM